MEILIKNQAVTKVLEDIAAEFQDICPDDYKAFIAYVQEESKALIRPNGFSGEGEIMNLMKIPSIHSFNGRAGRVNLPEGQSVNLYDFIKKSMKKYCGIDDFFRDHENYRLLCRVWKDAEVKRSHTKMVKVGFEAERNSA